MYGSAAGADTYFGGQLYATDWTGASTGDKTKALTMASEAVNRLKYKGVKNSVYTALVNAGADTDQTSEVMLASTSLTEKELAAADATQVDQFPRDGNADVPDDVIHAVYEEARELLSGRDPQQEYRNLVLNSDGVGSNRAGYDRGTPGPDHTKHHFVSSRAFQYLRPYLATGSSFNFRQY